MCNELIDIINEFKQKLEQKSFVKAIGGQNTANKLLKILQCAEKFINSRDTAIELIDRVIQNLYNVDRKVRSIMKELLKDNIRSRIDVLMLIKDTMPEDLRKLIERCYTKIKTGNSIDEDVLHFINYLLKDFNRVFEELSRIKELFQKC